MTVAEKAAYLKGLTEGLTDKESKEGKLWAVLSDLVMDMAHEIEELQGDSDDLADAVEEIGDELNYLEEMICDLDTPDMFDEDEEEDFDEEDFDGDAEIDDLDSEEALEAAADVFKLIDEYDGSEDDEEVTYDGIIYDVTCPACGEEFSFDDETLALGSTVCPGCGEVLEFDLDD